LKTAVVAGGIVAAGGMVTGLIIESDDNN